MKSTNSYPHFVGNIFCAYAKHFMYKRKNIKTFMKGSVNQIKVFAAVFRSSIRIDRFYIT